MPDSQRASLAVAFARSWFSWYVDGAPRPISASFAVTNRCTLRCSYCNTPFLDPSHLSLEQIELLFDRLKSCGIRRLGLAGGEPLVRKDIGAIVDAAKQRNFFVTMNSHLLLYEKRAAQLRGVDLFFTSLDGDRAAHEAVRGKGSYDGVLEAIASLVASNRPVVAICVVTEHSLDQAEHLLDTGEKMGFRVHFQPRCTDTEIVRGRPPEELTNARLRALWTRLIEAKQDGRPVASSMSYLRTQAGWRDFEMSAIADPKSRCAASRGFLYVDPHGRAYPCAFTKGKVEPVDLLGDDWRNALGQKTPCSRCNVGPHLEFNLLYQKPFRASLAALRSYEFAGE